MWGGVTTLPIRSGHVRGGGVWWWWDGGVTLWLVYLTFTLPYLLARVASDLMHLGCGGGGVEERRGGELELKGALEYGRELGSCLLFGFCGV